MILQLGKFHADQWGKLPIRLRITCRAGPARARVEQMPR
jgi:hypothetical protein